MPRCCCKRRAPRLRPGQLAWGRETPPAEGTGPADRARIAGSPSGGRRRRPPRAWLCRWLRRRLLRWVVRAECYRPCHFLCRPFRCQTLQHGLGCIEPQPQSVRIVIPWSCVSGRAGSGRSRWWVSRRSSSPLVYAMPRTNRRRKCRLQPQPGPHPYLHRSPSPSRKLRTGAPHNGHCPRSTR